MVTRLGGRRYEDSAFGYRVEYDVMNLHPDTRQDDCPCLIDGLQHREEKAETNATCYARSVASVSSCLPSPSSFCVDCHLQRAHSKNTYQPHLLRPWHLQPNHHRHRQHKQQYIRSHIQHCRRHIKRRSINAAPLGDGHIPVPSERRTSEDEREDKGDIVADDKEHACVDT